MFVDSVQGVNCYVCDGIYTNAQCNSAGSVQTCSSTDEICQNEILDDNGIHSIKKACKQDDSCYSEEDKNADECGLHLPKSHCRYCCTTNLCNQPENPSSNVPTTIPNSEVQTSTIHQTTELGELNSRSNLLMVGKHDAGLIMHRMIRTLSSQSAIRCAQQCMMERQCVSIYFGNSLCQLNTYTEESYGENINSNVNMKYYTISNWL
ncbi:uncharacterized protein [Antedon mediterranea]|uniref:uncharacterized protein n=1 Tax=Antedon mediterranea TaxID=105859 RepID=UPI003AF76D40